MDINKNLEVIINDNDRNSVKLLILGGSRVLLEWRVKVVSVTLGLESNFGICTTTFRTNDPSAK